MDERLHEIMLDNKVALYGLGTETERFLSQYGAEISVIGLLDSYRVDGELYGYPIISLSEAVSSKVNLIIIVARPGSCKAIAKKINGFCLENNIALYDVRGKNMLEKKHISYDFKAISGAKLVLLNKQIESVDVVSFDLFDTLITRRFLSYTDLFEVIDNELCDQSIIIPNFAQARLQAEKDLCRSSAPSLMEIYEYMLANKDEELLGAKELADLEWTLDFSSMIPRKAVCDIFQNLVSIGKTVIVTTDTYYSLDQINQILSRFGLIGADNVIVSSVQGTSKNQSLYEVVKKLYEGKKILHIGDDLYSDIEQASRYRIQTYRIHSSVDLCDELGMLGLDKYAKTISDRLKIGMFISEILNSPFWFDSDNRLLSVSNATQIGYLFFSPIIYDCLMWLRQSLDEQGYEQILFSSRDGFLPEKLFKLLYPKTNSVYFLSSRTAAIRAGMEDNTDIEYVDSMKFSGTPEEALRVRFGISTDDIAKIDREQAILDKATRQKQYYLKYIGDLGLQDKRVAFFDFVAKGTTQMYVQRLFDQHIKGFYFLQLEPEFMANKGLDIEPFYSDSAIFDNYYILETVLTSPDPQLEEFAEGGVPVFAVETRSQKDIRVVEEMQEGITSFFKQYTELLPEKLRICNKALDEKILELINKIQILDNDFLELKVEDPFFGRMTEINDLIGQ